MDKELRKLIDNYIPNLPDDELEDFEYFVKDSYDRIQKVEITNILPNGEEEIYLVVQSKSRRKVKGLRLYDGFSMSDLYDNKTDCKNDTHFGYNRWEALRERQCEES